MANSIELGLDIERSHGCGSPVWKIKLPEDLLSLFPAMQQFKVAEVHISQYGGLPVLRWNSCEGDHKFRNGAILCGTISLAKSDPEKTLQNFHKYYPTEKFFIGPAVSIEESYHEKGILPEFGKIAFVEKEEVGFYRLSQRIIIKA